MAPSQPVVQWARRSDDAPSVVTTTVFTSGPTGSSVSPSGSAHFPTAIVAGSSAGGIALAIGAIATLLYYRKKRSTRHISDNRALLNPSPSSQMQERPLYSSRASKDDDLESPEPSLKARVLDQTSVLGYLSPASHSGSSTPLPTPTAGTPVHNLSKENVVSMPNSTLVSVAPPVPPRSILRSSKPSSQRRLKRASHEHSPALLSRVPSNPKDSTPPQPLNVRSLRVRRREDSKSERARNQTESDLPPVPALPVPESAQKPEPQPQPRTSLRHQATFDRLSNWSEPSVYSTEGTANIGEPPPLLPAHVWLYTHNEDID